MLNDTESIALKLALAETHPYLNSEWNSDQDRSYMMEEACLGSVLISGTDSMPAINYLKPEHFFLIQHKLIFEAMLNIHNRKEDVEYLTVVDELRVQNQLARVGGPSYLTYLINNTGSHVYVITYANAIYESYRKRKAAELSGHLVNAATRSDTAAAVAINEELGKLLKEGYRSANPLKPYLIRADELKNLPVITWLVDGEIPERGLITLFGPSGVGKSFYALDLALQLAQDKTVVYIAAEGQAGYSQRVEAWCKFNKKPEGNLYFFMRDISFSDESERKQFTDLVKELNPCLVVIDTLADAMAGFDENSTRDMSTFLRTASRMKDELNSAVMFVHHTGKSGGTERGSSTLRGKSDTMIRLVDNDDQIAVECAKQKDAEKFPTKYLTMIKIEVESGGSVPVLIPDSQRERSATDPLTQNGTKVLKELGGHMMINGGSQSEIIAATGVPEGSIYYTLKRLLQLKHITKDGQSYVITEQGRGVLRSLGLLEYEPPPTLKALKALNQHSMNTQPRLGQHDAETQSTQSIVANFDDFHSTDPVSGVSALSVLSVERKKHSKHSINQLELVSASSTDPRKPCPDCGESNYYRNVVGDLKCRTCDQRRRQLDETAEV